MKKRQLLSVIARVCFFLSFIFSSSQVFSATNSPHSLLPSLEHQLQFSTGGDFTILDAKKYIAEYLNSADEEMIKGFELILQEDIYNLLKNNKNKENYALTLLVYLIANKAYLPDDTMTIALAIANNQLYSIADEPTRQQIKKDLLEHFRYYKKLLKWQKTMNIKYDLSRAPVIPKIYWAHRYRYMAMLGKIKILRIEQYNMFIDRIENLEFMHAILVKTNLALADSLVGIARNIEVFTKNNLLYRAKINQHRNTLKKNPNNQNARNAIDEFEKGEYMVDFMGGKRRWDLFYWLNYQIDTYKQYGYFKGDCVTETTFQMNLYKAAGIPAMATQVRPLESGGYSHNSPLYYNIFFDKWDTIQVPKLKGTYYLHFEKPVWHHLKYEKGERKYKRDGRRIYSSYWQGEYVLGNQIIQFRKRGFRGDHFEKLFLSDTTHTPGFIVNSTSAPHKLFDSDNDGIFDEFEIELNLNPESADSDGDGFADLWEIEWGFDPTDASSRPNNKTVAVDGLAEREIRELLLDVVSDPSGDYKADSEIYDIAGITGTLLDENIYIALTYHNNIHANTRDIHTLIISIQGSEISRLALQWVNGIIYMYEVTDKSWIKIKSNQQDFSICTVKDTEITIPLNIFNKGDVLKIRYWATGIKNGKGTNKSDISPEIVIEVTD